MKIETITPEVIETCLNRCPFPLIGNLIESFAKSSSKEMDSYLKFLHTPFQAYWEGYIHKSLETAKIYNELREAFKFFGGNTEHLKYIIEPINDIIETKYCFLAEEHSRLLEKIHNSKEYRALEVKIASSHLSHNAA